MNFVVLMGRMARDPQIRTINAQSGDMSVANFTIAVDRGGKDKAGSYTNKDGVKVYTTDVIVNRWEFCESKQQETEKKPDGPDGFMNVPDGIDEELPFN